MQNSLPAIASNCDGTNRPIYVWAPLRSQADALIELLGFVESESALPLSDLKEPVVTEGGANILLSWQGFVPYLCAAMDTGKPPTSARDEWIEQANELLSILRQQNKSFVSANILAVQQDPVVTRNLLTDLFGYRFRNDAPQQNQNIRSDNPILTYIALQTFLTSVPARRALAELQAFSRINTRADVESQTPGLDALFSELHAQIARKNSISSELAEVTSLNEALTEELDRARRTVEEVEATSTREREQAKANSREMVSKLQRDLDLVALERDALEVSQRGIQAKADEQKRHLNEQLSWSFNEIERYLKTSQDLEEQAYALEAEKLRLANELGRMEDKTNILEKSLQGYIEKVEALYNSTSWRATKPLRWIKQKISLSKHG